MASKLWKKFRADDLLKDMLTVLSGTAVSQLLIIISTYFFAKIYSPAEFGEFTLFFSVSAIIIQIISLRFEQSIILAEENETSRLIILNLFLVFFLGLFSIFFIDLLSWVGLIHKAILMPSYIKSLFVFYVILTGIWNFGQYVLIRNSGYKKISILAITRSFGIVSFTFFTWLMDPTLNGMIVGLTLGQLFGTILLLYFLIDREIFSSFQIRTFWPLMVKYRRFPFFQFPSVLVESFSGQMLTFYLTLSFPLSFAGHFSLANRTVNAPMDLIGGAVRTVFWEKASKAVAKTGSCRSLLFDTLKKLLFLAIGPAIILFFFGEDLFRLVFGEQWIIAGQIASILSIMMFFRFLANPVSSLFAIKNKQSIDLFIQLFILCTQYIVFFRLQLFSHEPLKIIGIFAAIYSFKYLMELYFSFRFSK